jgi:sugar phosphate isomerase/epimerase
MLTPFQQALKDLYDHHEAVLLEKTDAIERAGTAETQNAELRAMLELCVDAADGIKVKVAPGNMYMIDIHAWTTLINTINTAKDLLVEHGDDNAALEGEPGDSVG